ncbi:pentapeptide repeat-containing protein [Embleya hyalina]|uniref:Pentapeptide repeat-containing protein n=1 Tax=Embleya hyalina TaxID=516124 RepID=A0A401YYX0_9ACTN|nr:pentapeptide repeat-containing protein [Embleya hyalina]GCD99695.1 hypothetical protein EHYA_07417 [Embleya hyalina]
MTSPPAPSPTPPPWPHCAEGTTTTDLVGCRGIYVTGHTRCLAHLGPADRTAYLASLTPGADVNHCGTTLDGPLLTELLYALRDPTTTHPRLGNADFRDATFTANAWFQDARFIADADFRDAAFAADAHFQDATFAADAYFQDATFAADANFPGTAFTSDAYFQSATFTAGAYFRGATFTADANFDDATFTARANFRGATFTADANFLGATFTASAWFQGVTFAADANFLGARFTASAWFQRVTFAADADFHDATFTAGAYFRDSTFTANAYFQDATFTTYAGFRGVVVGGNARFDGGRFNSLAVLGPLWCQGVLDLSEAVFGMPVVIEAAVGELRCGRTRWEATATLRLWHGDLDMSGAVLNFPLAVVSAAAGTDPVRVLSVNGVDAAHLVLTDTDLTVCRLLGAFHLDQLRLEGDTRFARTPAGIDPLRGMPVRWTDRLALAEEHHWRALPAHRPRLRAGWTPAPPLSSGSPPTVPGPAALAALYRQLRKAFEDGKDEPGAADFYMGEMEMRRLDRRPGRPRAERGLLTAYWALSGYGLRASRALTWLLLAMTVTVLAMMLWGLPTSDPEPRTNGTLAGQNIALTTDTPDPVLTGPPHTRLTGKRAEKATRVVLNSVVFRSSGQNLTTRGAYIEMASRFLEPVLLGLAALAIRGRVKR